MFKIEKKIKTFLVILVVGLFLNGCCSYKTIQHCVNDCVEREMMRGKPRSYGLTICPAECKFQVCIPF
jgi:PBP1b-binding outer membrane lipoprotein LpoB